jgi:hypothetical protein
MSRNDELVKIGLDRVKRSINKESRAMTNDKSTELNTTHPAITQEALAHLGDGQLAYVKEIRSEDVAGMFPEAPKVAPGIKLFSLHAADGTPIMLTDTREAALANAWSQELEAVSLH